MKDYQNYSAEELALDPFFIKWVTHPTIEREAFWLRWIENHPEHQQKVAQAQQLVKTVQFKTYPAPSVTQDKIWNELQILTSHPVSQNTSRSFIRWYYPVAASILFLLIAGYWLMDGAEVQNISYITTFGETKEIRLPDGTMVRLNANSILQVPAKWPKQGDRSVWLQGEAFFHVNKAEDFTTAKPRDFMVHTDDVVITVKGTEFNVKQRRKTTQVVLQSGKVEVAIPHQKQQIPMMPGEMISYAADKDSVQVRQVDPSIYTSWQENQLIFDQVTVQEIANVLEDSYGYTVVIQPDSLKREIFSGSTPAKDLNVLLLSLKATLEVAIEQRNDSILIQKNDLHGSRLQRKEP